MHANSSPPLRLPPSASAWRYAMPASSTVRASASRLNCGWRREPGKRRTSTSVRTPASRRHSRSSSALRAPCPIVKTRIAYSYTGLDAARARADQSGGGRSRGQSRADSDAARRREGAGGGRRPLSRTRRHRLSAGGPAPAAGLRARGRAVARGDRAGRARDRRDRRHAALRPRPVQRGCGVRRRRGAQARPQALPAELRRLRRVPLLRAGRGARRLRARRRTVRRHDLRRHVAAGLAGAELLVNISASPFHLLRDREREEMFRTRARDNACFVAFCNTVGGQDELIFDGHSLVIDDEGTVLARAPGFEEALLVIDVEPSSVVGRRLTDTRRRALLQDRGELGPVEEIHVGGARKHAETRSGDLADFCDDLEQMRLSLELGLADYVRKNGFGETVLGVSGGIDSALVAALAVEALGAERVHCVSMPSRYSSAGTRGDAQRLAENLGCEFREIAIEPMVEAYLAALAPSFAERDPDLTEENLQARIRGTLLMALSNKFGWLLIATGNKSEMSVGYATLYGDMAGGFALLKDVFKTDVFRLSRHL